MAARNGMGNTCNGVARSLSQSGNSLRSILGSNDSNSERGEFASFGSKSPTEADSKHAHPMEPSSDFFGGDVASALLRRNGTHGHSHGHGKGHTHQHSVTKENAVA